MCSYLYTMPPIPLFTNLINNPFSDSLKLNAASVVLAFDINPATDAKGQKILPDPNNLLDEGLAV